MHGASEQMKVMLTSYQIFEGNFFIHREVSSSNSFPNPQLQHIVNAVKDSETETFGQINNCKSNFRKKASLNTNRNKYLKVKKDD